MPALPILCATAAFVHGLSRSRLAAQVEIQALRHQLCAHQRTHAGPRLRPRERILRLPQATRCAPSRLRSGRRNRAPRWPAPSLRADRGLKPGRLADLALVYAIALRPVCPLAGQPRADGRYAPSGTGNQADPHPPRLSSAAGQIVERGTGRVIRDGHDPLRPLVHMSLPIAEDSGILRCAARMRKGSQEVPFCVQNRRN